MKHPPRRKKKRSRGDEPPASSTLTRADKLTLWAYVLGISVAVFLIFHLLTTHEQTVAFDRLIAGWKRDYHLSDEQARRIRAMEEQFHGNGDPFMRPGRTPAETSEHHRQMAGVMNPEDAARFLEAQEGRGRSAKPRH